MPPKRSRVEEEVQTNETMQELNGDDRRIGEDQKGAGRNDQNHAQYRRR